MKQSRRIYSTKQWRKVRMIVLKNEPLCRVCKLKGLTVEATEVDHIIPLFVGGKPFDISNLQPICFECHVLKSSNEKPSIIRRGRVTLDGTPMNRL